MEQGQKQQDTYITAPATGQAAQEIAANCQTLPELQKAVNAFDSCPLKQTSTHTVFCDGNPQADLMIIGEAPGFHEDKQGKPFVGPSGKLLDKFLKGIGRNRASAYITNVLFWRPPNNRTPFFEELQLCRPFVERHIALVAPKVVIFSGGTSAKFMLNNQTGIMRLRGRWHNYTNQWLDEPIPAMPTYHPSFLLRTPGQKKYAWQDFLAVKEKLSN